MITVECEEPPCDEDKLEVDVERVVWPHQSQKLRSHPLDPVSPYFYRDSTYSENLNDSPKQKRMKLS